MTSLIFPDVNVCLAIMHADHPHRKAGRQWLSSDLVQMIGISRIVQISLLRLMTTSSVMNNRPLSMEAAWQAYDRLFEDERVSLFPEPGAIEPLFRKYSSASSASPKLWADSYLLAFAKHAQGTLVTFDRALAARSESCLLLS